MSRFLLQAFSSLCPLSTAWGQQTDENRGADSSTTEQGAVATWPSEFHSTIGILARRFIKQASINLSKNAV
jgi:hypothetical protein